MLYRDDGKYNGNYLGFRDFFELEFEAFRALVSELRVYGFLVQSSGF